MRCRYDALDTWSVALWSVTSCSEEWLWLSWQRSRVDRRRQIVVYRVSKRDCERCVCRSQDQLLWDKLRCSFWMRIHIVPIAPIMSSVTRSVFCRTDNSAHAAETVWCGSSWQTFWVPQSRRNDGDAEGFFCQYIQFIVSMTTNFFKWYVKEIFMMSFCLMITWFLEDMINVIDDERKWESVMTLIVTDHSS